MRKASSTTPAVSDLKSHLGFWLRCVSNHVSHAFAQKLLESGVTVAEWVVLRELYQRDDMTPSVLADQTGLTRGGATKLIDRLVARKLVTRRERDDDRRYQTITLTSAAQHLVPQLAAIADTNDEEFFSTLSPAERRALLDTLKKLVQRHHLHKIPIE